MGKKSKSKSKKKQKQKQKKLAAAPDTVIAAAPSPSKVTTSGENLVMLGIRLSPEERDKIKVYAVQHQTSVASLIRQYIQSLPG